jgi:hypothetical protein
MPKWRAPTLRSRHERGSGLMARGADLLQWGTRSSRLAEVAKQVMAVDCRLPRQLRRPESDEGLHAVQFRRWDVPSP